MAGKFALIIANTEYNDPGLAQLTAPGKDAKEFARVLDSPDICAFDDVIILFNEDVFKVNESIDYFFSNKKNRMTCLSYISQDMVFAMNMGRSILPSRIRTVNDCVQRP